MVTRLVVCFVLLLIATHVAAQDDATSVPRADETSTSADADQALEAFVLGTEAAASGRTADAVLHFQRSLTLVPKASTAFNLAVTLRGVGRTLEAEAILQAAIDGEYGPNESLEPLLEARLAEVRREIAVLHVIVELESPVEALPWIELDGERVDASMSPQGEHHVIELRLNAGSHRVRAGADGVVADTQRVSLRRGDEDTMSFRLLRPRDPGRLRVEASDEDARVRLWRAGSASRDAIADASGGVDLSLQPGRYRLLVQGVDDDERVVEIISGSHAEIDVDVSGRRLRARGIVLLTSAALLVGGAVVAGVIFGTRDAEPVEPPVWGNTQVLRPNP